MHRDFHEKRENSVCNSNENSVRKRVFRSNRLGFCVWQLALLRSVVDNTTLYIWDDRCTCAEAFPTIRTIMVSCSHLLCGFESFPVFTFSFFFLSLVFGFQLKKKKNIERRQWPFNYMGVWSIGHGRFHVLGFVIIFTEYNTFYYEYNNISTVIHSRLYQLQYWFT